MRPSSSLKRKFFDSFPPPQFLEMPAVGLDVSDEVVRFAELKRRGDHFEIGMYGEKKIPKDVIEEGYVKNPQELTKILRSLQEEHNLHFVTVSLPEEKSYLFKTQVPAMEEGDIRGALQYKIEENVPVALKDAVFDFRIMRHSTAAQGNIDVGVTVTHMKVIESYMPVFKDAGLVPLRLIPESQAIANVVIAQDDPGTYILVAVRETKTVFAIVSEGVIQFSSTLPIGSESLSDSIKKSFSVGEEEAKKIQSGKETRDSNEMFMSLVNAASVVRDEIQKLLAYWYSHGPEGDSKIIRSIILSGSPVLFGLEDYVSRSFDIPVKVADAWINIASLKEYLPTITQQESLDFIPALGLALPYD